MENQVRVTVQSEEELRWVAEVLDGEEAMEFERLTPEDSQKKARKEAMLRRALDDALEQKRVYEETLKIRLIPRQITQSYVTREGGRIRMGDQEGRALFMSRALQKAVPLPSDEVATGFGQVTYRMEVELTFTVATTSL